MTDGVGAVLETIDLIYAAALEPSLWDDALRGVARLCGAQAAGIRVERGTELTQRWIGLEEKFNAAYVDHYWREDPWALPARARPPGDAGFGDMIVPRRELLKSAFYNELSKPYGLDDLVGAVITRTPERMITLGVMGATRTRFSEPQKVLIERLVPHLARAIYIGERLLFSPVESGVPTLEERLQVGYALTRAEARVAAHVGRGFVPKQAAVAIGTSWNTVRFQLRQVYAKTRTSGQAELARLCARLELGRLR